MIDFRTQVENAVTLGWNSGAMVGIVFQVTHNGQYLEGITFPHGTDTIRTVQGEHAVIINLSLTACKSFNYVSEYKQFVYDVCVKGKAFFGNIPPELVIDVFDMKTGESFYNPLAPVADDREAMVETPAHNFAKVTLVSSNSKIAPAKSTASLKVVH